MKRLLTVFGLCLGLVSPALAQSNGAVFPGGGGSVSFPLNAGAGLVGTPSINFGTANTGIYASGAGHLSFAAGGAGQLDIQAGNVSVQSGANLTLTGGAKGLALTTGNGLLAVQMAGAGTNYLGIGPTSNTSASLGWSSIGAGGTMTAALSWNDSSQVLLPAIASDATHTDSTVCQDTTSHILFSGSGTAGICLGTSSARFKHDIAPLDIGLDEIMKLKPVRYKLNADHGDPDKLLYGFTAEQMQEAIPALVGLDNNGRPNTADYMGVVPGLVKAIQQQQAAILQQQAEIEDLKSRLK